VAAVLLVLASGCGVGGGTGKLHGVTRALAKQVGGVPITEVRSQRPDTLFHFKAAPGHLLFTFFGFTHCPDLCPTTLGDLRRALRRLGASSNRIDVSFITVDPDRDSSEVLARYLSSFFLGGHALRPATHAELLAVQAAFGATSSVTRRADGDSDVAHTAASYIVDEHGRVLLEWDFGTSSGDMAADLKTLLARMDRARP
jgi:cytochrome oxidase Cu insertion factor (SCO1/SenC/PrrC family)